MIEIKDLNIEVPGFAVRDVNLDIGQGEFFCLLGPTGSGKTLILESIAGLVRAAKGRIRAAGRDVTRMPPERRGIGIVYQDDALFPHMTVMENIRYGLKYHCLPQAEAGALVDRLVQTLDLAHVVHRGTSHLSGGEKRRVSLARALAVRPSVLLLDEPMSALDPNFHEDVQRLLKRLNSELGATFLMVTHDFAEAMFLADRVAVIRNGRIEQTGKTAEVFQKPATIFTARFVGMKNIFPVRFNGERAEFLGLSFPLSSPLSKEDGHVALRPEDVFLRRQNNFPSRFVVYPGKMLGIVSRGFHFEARVRCGRACFKIYVDKKTLLEAEVRENKEVFVGFDPAEAHVF
ncbi:MAG: ABC transporter ATP-binding protein [Thermodesulfobacteriota bacterium]|nr:ABC transporter ATP-binding protein [Thermodesulfobacteriota bacterium]